MIRILILNFLFLFSLIISVKSQEINAPIDIIDSTTVIILHKVDPGIKDPLLINRFLRDSTLWLSPESFESSALMENNELWIKTRLPYLEWKDAALYLHGYTTRFEIYIDSTLIFNYAPGDSSGDYKYYNSFIISLDSNYQGRNMVLRFKYSDPLNVVSFFDLLAGAKDDLFRKALVDRITFLRENLVDFILGIFIIFAGLFALTVFLFRWRKFVFTYASFSIFTLATGVNLSIFFLFQIVNIEPRTFNILNEIVGNLVPIGFLCMMAGIAESNRSYFFRLMVGIHICYTLYSINNPFFAYTLYLYWGLVLFEMGYIIYLIVREKMLQDQGLRIPVYFIFVYMLFTLHDLLVDFGVLPWNIVIYGWALVGVIFSFGYYLELRFINSLQKIETVTSELEETRVQLLLMENQNIQSRFEALKNQVNPHFLFNSLNTLASIIKPQPDKAVRFVQEFADMYRYILDFTDKIVIPVDEELKFVNSYYYLQKLRFDKNLTMKVEIDPSLLNEYIPPLSLQLLIENAIKHNEISDLHPLHIQISSKEGYLVVTNNLNPLDNGIYSAKVGLKNLHQRYALLTDAKPEFYAEQGNYIAKIPIISDAN